MVAKSKSAKTPRKAVSKTPARKVAAKPAPKVIARTPAKAPAKAAPKSAPAPAKGRAPVGKAPVAKPVPAAPPPISPTPRPASAAKTVVTASAQEVAAAHEYLLDRSAHRSEEPVVINGRRLPTEEQLLKMPDAAYMNDEQLAFFKHRLQRMEQELLANAGETTEHLRETVIVPDPADRATIEEEHALELRTRDRERKLLKKVQSALQRIDSGDYGYCEETGDPIGIPRLIARPTATLSLEAQQRRELKQKLFGD
jgi:DnaK suppressor protein